MNTSKSLEEDEDEEVVTRSASSSKRSTMGTRHRVLRSPRSPCLLAGETSIPEVIAFFSDANAGGSRERRRRSTPSSSRSCTSYPRTSRYAVADLLELRPRLSCRPSQYRILILGQRRASESAPPRCGKIAARSRARRTCRWSKTKTCAIRNVRIRTARSRLIVEGDPEDVTRSNVVGCGRCRPDEGRLKFAKGEVKSWRRRIRGRGRYGAIISQGHDPSVCWKRTSG